MSDENSIAILDESNHKPEKPGTCSSINYQTATVSIPITVTPSVKAGMVTTKCCGAPVVTPGISCCCGKNRSFSFTITQDICVEVPIELGATANTGNPQIDCVRPGCGKEPPHHPVCM